MASPSPIVSASAYMPPYSATPPKRSRAAAIHTKISFGVILTQVNPRTSRPEAILVRGRYSYEYSEFVHGRYSRKNIRAVEALFSAMSINERLTIYSLDFEKMWYLIWLTTTNQEELYHRKHAKFQSTWMQNDCGKRLRELIMTSQTTPTPLRQDGGVRWEFPKGKRQSKHEPDINCAIREFKEESGIDKRDYQILPGFKRRISYVHMGVRYVNVYYVAVARRTLRPSLDLRALVQAAEVSEVRWMDIEQMRLIDDDTQRLEKTIAPVFAYVKRYLQGKTQIRSLTYRMTPSGEPVDLARLLPGRVPRRQVSRKKTTHREGARKHHGGRKKPAPKK